MECDGRFYKVYNGNVRRAISEPRQPDVEKAEIPIVVGHTQNDHLAEKNKQDLALVTKKAQGVQRNAKKPRVATRDEVAKRKEALREAKQKELNALDEMGIFEEAPDSVESRAGATHSFWALTWKLTSDQEKGVFDAGGPPGVAKARLVPLGNRDPQQDELKVNAATPR